MALKIIDVSKYQGKIDWAKVKQYIDGAVIQVGYGDDLKSQDDPYANYNMGECERLGIPYMTYLYSYADSDPHIQSEIEHEKRMTVGRRSLWHWLDLEENCYRKFAMSAAKSWLKAFSDSGIYSFLSWWNGPLLGLNCRKWIASYPPRDKDNGTIQKKYKPDEVMTAWQYSSKCRIPGILGNVDVSEWYGSFGENKPVNETLRPVYKKEVAVIIMRHLCTESEHGYTQDMSNRWGSGEDCLVDVYGRAYKIAGGDRDCSSAVISAYEAAGISCGGATYTGNMKECMVATKNFVWRPMTYIAQTGDLYLNKKYHTAMCLSDKPDVLMQFSINEKGKVKGGKTGDQLQKGSHDEQYGRGESHIRMYYDYPWDGILECVNNEVAFYIEDIAV